MNYTFLLGRIPLTIGDARCHFLFGIFFKKINDHIREKLSQNCVKKLYIYHASKINPWSFNNFCGFFVKTILECFYFLKL
jgi:hypothetical protein